MSLTLATPLVVMFVGLLLYLFAVPPRPREIGRIMFRVGLLATLLRLTLEHVLRSR